MRSRSQWRMGEPSSGRGLTPDMEGEAAQRDETAKVEKSALFMASECATGFEGRIIVEEEQKA